MNITWRIRIVLKGFLRFNRIIMLVSQFMNKHTISRLYFVLHVKEFGLFFYSNKIGYRNGVSENYNLDMLWKAWIFTFQVNRFFGTSRDMNYFFHAYLYYTISKYLGACAVNRIRKKLINS